MERGSIAHFAMITVLVGMLGCAACATQKSTTQAPTTGSEWSEAPTSTTEEVETSRAAKVGFQTVYFDFDRFDIRSDARPVLKANAGAMGDTSGVVEVEGNTDERGSAEYNLALGERRANAVKRYLVDLGVPASKLRTVSFGEERSAVQGHDESAWRYNRRVDFVAGR
jgi:peptidoglycan-associated lipoprotein